MSTTSFVRVESPDLIQPGDRVKIMNFLDDDDLDHASRIRCINRVTEWVTVLEVLSVTIVVDTKAIVGRNISLLKRHAISEISELCGEGILRPVQSPVCTVDSRIQKILGNSVERNPAPTPDGFIPTAAKGKPAIDRPKKQAVERRRKRYSIDELLEEIEHHGTIAGAAKALGISCGGVTYRLECLPDSDPRKQRYLTLRQHGLRHSTDKLLDAIEHHGTVIAAAAALGMGLDVFRARMKKLPDGSPQKQRYQRLTRGRGHFKCTIDELINAVEKYGVAGAARLFGYSSSGAITSRISRLPDDDPRKQHFYSIPKGNVCYEMETLINVIEQSGSVSKASKALGIRASSIYRRFSRLPDDDPLRQRFISVCRSVCKKQGRPQKVTIEQMLEAIEQYGSPTKASIALGLSKTAISTRIRNLPDDDPRKQRYLSLIEGQKSNDQAG